MDCTPVILAHETPFSIGAVEISPSTRELRNNGKSAILEPRVMQVLVALHRANGSVVSKDDLVTCCWEGRIVGDDAINRVIGRLRHDASDHADDAFRVETITRVGYRLVANGASRVAAIDRRKLVMGGTAAAAAAAAGAIGWQFVGRDRLSGDAKDLYDEARAAVVDGSAEQVTNAVSKLNSASQMAPNSADIWGLLAAAYACQISQIPADQRSLTTARAASAANRALSIDPNNGDALAARTWSVPMYGNWLEFERVAREGYKRSPGNWMLNRTMAVLLCQVGRNRESLVYLQRALRAESQAPHTHMLMIFSLWDNGRLAEAEEEIGKAFALWPRMYGIWFARFYFLMFNGRPQEAMVMMRDLSSRPVGIPEWNLDLTELQAEALASRDPAKINDVVAKWRKIASVGTGFSENAFVFAGRTGRNDDAFAVLDGLYFDRGFHVAGQRWSREQGYYASRRDRNTYILFEYGMNDLRRDPRFARVTRETGLDDYWRRSGSKPDYLA